MNPRLLFPVLAGAFVVLAALSLRRERRIVPAARTWILLAVIFAAVSVWLHWAP